MLRELTKYAGQITVANRPGANCLSSSSLSQPRPNGTHDKPRFFPCQLCIHQLGSTPILRSYGGPATSRCSALGNTASKCGPLGEARPIGEACITVSGKIQRPSQGHNNRDSAPRGQIGRPNTLPRVKEFPARRFGARPWSAYQHQPRKSRLNRTRLCSSTIDRSRNGALCERVGM